MQWQDQETQHVWLFPKDGLFMVIPGRKIMSDLLVHHVSSPDAVHTLACVHA